MFVTHVFCNNADYIPVPFQSAGLFVDMPLDTADLRRIVVGYYKDSQNITTRPSNPSI